MSRQVGERQDDPYKVKGSSTRIDQQESPCAKSPEGDQPSGLIALSPESDGSEDPKQNDQWFLPRGLDPS
jgi:hypothetical protein